MQEFRAMPMTRNVPDPSKFNSAIELPFQLRVEDVRSAMQDVYDFFFDVNVHRIGKHLDRLDDMLRKANMSGMLSDMLTASLARHSRSLVVNEYHNGHPDLIVRGQYPNNRERAGEHGVEVKTTLKSGGAVDTHGARNQGTDDFRHNSRGTLGTRTATLHAEGIAKLRRSWVYLDQPPSTRKPARRGKASQASSK